MAGKKNLLMATPAVTLECTPGSHRNWRKITKLPLRLEMSPDSAAMPAKQYRVPIQTCKEP